MPSLIFTNDWFYPNLITWPIIFKDIPSNAKLNILEIGSYEGRSTIWFCNRFKNSKITCVDIFVKDKEANFNNNIKETKIEHRITKVKGVSWKALKKVDDKFDIIYVDAGHTVQEAMTDLCLSWPMLKVGGILIFDDYSHPRYNCCKAMDFFVEYFDGNEVIHKDRQVAVKKIKESMFSISSLNK
jgi:predicted O-methyltransferase YrrM